MNLLDDINASKKKVREIYRLNPGNNINLICEKLIELNEVGGAYVECGVFQGNTLFSIATFMQQRSIHREMLGCDTFEGFPERKTDFRDRPQFFSELYKTREITQEHYLKAAKRTKDFTDESHLNREYFLDVKKVFDIAKDYKNTQLIKGDFKSTLKTINQPIAILYLDCDLYQSYHECLDSLFSKVVSKGVIIFDEYYSLKYPGARLAVNEFMNDKEGYLEVYHTEDDFERWCYLKN